MFIFVSSYHNYIIRQGFIVYDDNNFTVCIKNLILGSINQNQSNFMPKKKVRDVVIEDTNSNSQQTVSIKSAGNCLIPSLIIQNKFPKN